MTDLPNPRRPPPPAVSLDRLRADAAETDRHAVATNTARAYKSDWESWLGFCTTHGLKPLPADPEHVRLYLNQLTSHGGRAGRPLRPRTAERHLAAIAAAHRARDLEFQTNHPTISRALDGIRRRHGVRQQGATALRTTHILSICSRLGLDARSVRNKALILLGFAGGFRRSELVALDVPDLAFTEAGLIVDLLRSKTDQAGKGRRVGIARGSNPETCPVAAVRAWLRLADIEHEPGPLFLPVNRWDVVEALQGRLSDKAVDRAVKWACDLAGLEGSFSAHSLRAGHVTESRSHGADPARVKGQTGHKSDHMLDRYNREAELFVNNSSAYLGL